MYNYSHYIGAIATATKLQATNDTFGLRHPIHHHHHHQEGGGEEEEEEEEGKTSLTAEAAER